MCLTLPSWRIDKSYLKWLSFETWISSLVMADYVAPSIILIIKLWIFKSFFNKIWLSNKKWTTLIKRPQSWPALTPLWSYMMTESMFSTTFLWIGWVKQDASPLQTSKFACWALLDQGVRKGPQGKEYRRTSPRWRCLSPRPSCISHRSHRSPCPRSRQGPSQSWEGYYININIIAPEPEEDVDMGGLFDFWMESRI